MLSPFTRWRIMETLKKLLNCMGNEYIQHNPDVEDGKKDLLNILLEC